MKKYLSMLAVVAVAASAFAQGTVNFANNGTTLVKAGADAASAVAVPVNGGYVQFLWAPSGTAAGAYTGQSLTAWLGANTAWKAVDTSIKAKRRRGKEKRMKTKKKKRKTKNEVREDGS